MRSLRPEDRAAWIRMRTTLWPDAGGPEAAADADEWLATPGAVVLVAEAADGGTLVGFAEVGQRAYADGCDTSPVAYLEGWFVEAAWRRRGVGRALVEAAEGWARAQGLQELASDVELPNRGSQRAHRALGFEEVGRAVLYRKRVDGA